MENSSTIRKWTELEGLAAVALETGKKIGALEDFYINPQNSEVLGFQVKTGMFGHRVLPVGAISGIGADAVTFVNEEQLLKESDAPQLANMIYGRTLLKYRVISESGTVVGEIDNVLLDITNPAAIVLKGYQLGGGLREKITGHYQAFAASEVVRYGQDVIILSESVAQELTKR
jgi:uncharacterized protein YrrD